MPDPIDDALDKIEAELNQPPLVGVVIDKSGSMKHLTQDTITGFAEFLQEQQRHDVRLLITLFDTNVDMRPIEHAKDVKPLDESTYRPDGLTALLDAVGLTIQELDKHQARRVLCIITDGAENASKEYTYSQIRETILKRQDDGWEVLFLGANLDAMGEAAKIGVRGTHSAAYAGANTSDTYRLASSNVTRSHSGPAGQSVGAWTDDERHQLLDTGDDGDDG